MLCYYVSGGHLEFLKIFVTNTDPMTSAPEYATASVLCSAVTRRQPAGGPVLIMCDPQVSGRYVGIQLRDTQQLTLCEVDIYGKLKPYNKSRIYRTVSRL